jgi:ABC-type transport system involved in multi-copper enzyme maturation permease subunit
VRLRLGPGPVFVYEWLLATRRWQLYALRAGFLTVILVAMSLAWPNTFWNRRPDQTVSVQMMAYLGESLFETIASIELTLVLLAAPAATAGAVCLARARGTLDHMLATDLSNGEIVLGKLGVGLVPVLGLVAGVLPIMALVALLGGVDPIAIVGSFVVATGCAVLGSSLAMVFSLWGRKTNDVLMITYLILILWVISPAMAYMAALSSGIPPPGLIGSTSWEWLKLSNPFYLVFAPYWDPGRVDLTTYAGFLVACLCLTGMLAAFVTVRIRKAASSQAGRPAAAARGWTHRSAHRVPRRVWFPALPGPSLDGNPVLWREWHGSKPSRMMRGARLLYAGLGIIWIAFAVMLIKGSPAACAMICVMCDFQVAMGLLLLSVAASTSLAEERVHGNLDLLLSTPLPTRSIVIGKWWGAFRSVRSLMIWAALIAGVLVVASGRCSHYGLLLGLILSYGAVIASLGLALATWVGRPGRAVALAVTIYVVFSIGWIILIFLLDSGPFWTRYLCMGSPFFGTFWAACGVTDTPISPDPTEDWPAALFCALALCGIAVILFAATVATFDRCLGRVAKRPDARSLLHRRIRPELTVVR